MGRIKQEKPVFYEELDDRSFRTQESATQPSLYSGYREERANARK
jgi:hypothetical protein